MSHTYFKRWRGRLLSSRHVTGCSLHTVLLFLCWRRMQVILKCHYITDPQRSASFKGAYIFTETPRQLFARLIKSQFSIGRVTCNRRALSLIDASWPLYSNQFQAGRCVQARCRLVSTGCCCEKRSGSRVLLDRRWIHYCFASVSV